MQVLHDFPELKSARAKITGKLGFVPTMGALHAGHLALVKEGRKFADKVMVSIFVNPTQFGANEDLAKYPRDIAADLQKLKGLADYVYVPRVGDIYPNGEKITVKAGAAAEGLESDFRPGHFDGVATVVSILFAQVKPDIAVFGEKDFQQLMVIRELGSEVEILSLPTIREADGLAMSSRNVYLSAEERKIAPLLYSSLRTAAEAIHIGAGLPRSSRNDEIRGKLEEKGFKVQYIAECWGRRLAAVYLGNTRLIDNVALNFIKND